MTVISVVDARLAGMDDSSAESSTLAAADVPRSTVISADSSSGICTITVLALSGLLVRLMDFSLGSAFSASISRSITPVLVRSRPTRAEVLAGVRMSVGMSIAFRREVSKLTLDILMIFEGISSCSTLIPLATNIGIWIDKVVLDSGFPLRLISPV